MNLLHEWLNPILHEYGFKLSKATISNDVKKQVTQVFISGTPRGKDRDKVEFTVESTFLQQELSKIEQLKELVRVNLAALDPQDDEKSE